MHGLSNKVEISALASTWQDCFDLLVSCQRAAYLILADEIDLGLVSCGDLSLLYCFTSVCELSDQLDEAENNEFYHQDVMSCHKSMQKFL